MAGSAEEETSSAAITDVEELASAASGDEGPRDSPAGSGETAEADALDVGARPRHIRPRWTTATLERSRRRLVVALALLALTGVALTAAGVDMVWSSTAGRYVTPGLQPDDPNYVALVTPTPTLLVVSVDDEENLTGVSLISLRSGDEGGSVIVMPVAMRVPAANESSTSFDADGPSEDAGLSSEDTESTATLADVYDDLGTAGVRQGVERIFRVAVAELIQVDDGGWASLLDPIEPLSLTVPDAVGTRWPAGEVDLEAEDVGEFLATTAEDQSELNRVARQELFWQAWIPAVSTAGEQAVPGELDAGLGRFVSGLSAGPLSVTGLPVVQDGDDGDAELFTVDSDVIADIVAREIPYPQEPWAGSRIRVRLLNGTTDTDLALRATGPLVMAQAEIAVAGNAGSLDRSRTTFVYSDDDQRQAAEALRDALGVGVVEQEPQSGRSRPVDDDNRDDRVDVTVILGADAAQVIGR